MISPVVYIVVSSLPVVMMLNIKHRFTKKYRVPVSGIIGLTVGNVHHSR
nr:putative NADH dehydrogenase subunit 6 [Picea sitchensis]